MFGPKICNRTYNLVIQNTSYETASSIAQRTRQRHSTEDDASDAGTRHAGTTSTKRSDAIVTLVERRRRFLHCSMEVARRRSRLCVGENRPTTTDAHLKTAAGIDKRRRRLLTAWPRDSVLVYKVSYSSYHDSPTWGPYSLLSLGGMKTRMFSGVFVLDVGVLLTSRPSDQVDHVDDSPASGPYIMLIYNENSDVCECFILGVLELL